MRSPSRTTEHLQTNIRPTTRQTSIGALAASTCKQTTQVKFVANASGNGQTACEERGCESLQADQYVSGGSAGLVRIPLRPASRSLQC
jgi:hypothetical protein